MTGSIRGRVAAFFGRLSPLEQAALFSSVFAAVMVAGFSLSVYFPDGNSTAFAVEHYVGGLVLALLVALLFSKGPKKGRDLLLLARNVTAFSVIVFLHFNFKLWAQLVNPHLFDDWYQFSDELLSPLVDGIVFINMGYLPLKEWLPNAYHDVFIFMFFLSFAVHAVTRTGRACLGELATAVALVLSLGGIAYMIAPAWGPFIYSPDDGSVAFHLQRGMSAFQTRFVASAGLQYEGAEFISPLAAMPSLHIAHVWVLWIYAARHVRWLGYAYLPALVFILTEAVASRWHYVVDLVVGVCLAYLCIFLAARMHGSRVVRQNDCENVGPAHGGVNLDAR